VSEGKGVGARDRADDPETRRATTDECLSSSPSTEREQLVRSLVADWQELIELTPEPRTLLEKWRAERDQRDKLAVPIAQRLDLLRQIAPEEVAS
jgi:hypothetical protein